MTTIAILLTAFALGADVPEHLKNLTGCFKVDYRFYEDGVHNLEIVQALERIDYSEKDGVHTLQHVGIHEGEEMKHFREDWAYEGADRWNQRIYGPSGDYRYTCNGVLKFNQLHCQSIGAPKPLRDVKRTDYKVLDRTTTLQFTPKGWVQSERNNKKADTHFISPVVAMEVGWVEYKRVDESNCVVK